jgi:hypothetical protein
MDAKALKQTVLYAFNHRPFEIEEHMKVCHGTAVRLPRKIQKLGLTYEAVNAMTPSEFEKLWYQRSVIEKDTGEPRRYLEPDLEAMHKEYIASRQHDGTRSAIKIEQTHANVVRMMYLTEENQQKAAQEGMQLYSEYHVLRMWRRYEKKVSPVFRRSYPSGYAAELDFAGITLPYTSDGETREATLMVMVLPASRMLIVKAIGSQRSEHVCPAIAECLREYGALPQVLVVDNFKGAVNRSNVYGGEVNPTMRALGHFFGMEIVTCRPFHGVDKGCVEACVKITNRYIGATIASMRRHGQEFHSLEELNSSIAPIVERINNRRIRGLKKTRRELFAEEKLLMRHPASWDYQYPDRVIEQKLSATAVFTHGKHQYALPAKWCGANIEVEISDSSLIFYSGGTFITMYKCKDKEPGLSTHENYTPNNHLAAECFEVADVEQFLMSWAEAIGPDVKRWVSQNRSRNVARQYSNHSCYGLLTMVGGNKSDYKGFNRCVQECMASHGDLPSCATILQHWKKQTHSRTVESDTIYTPENFRNSCVSYMLGQTERLCWPVKEITGDAVNYLRSDEEWKEQYSDLAGLME